MLPPSTRPAARLLALVLPFLTGPARAEPERPRPTFRLDYRLIGLKSLSYCPSEQTVRALLNRLFRYEAIQPTAGPALAIDIVSNPNQHLYYELTGHVLREDGVAIYTQEYYSHDATAMSCFRAVYQTAVALEALATEAKPEQFKVPPPRAEPLTITLQPRRVVTAPSTPAPAPAALPAAVAPWKLPYGFLLGVGLTSSVGLTPTPTLGGVGALSYRRGAWSGALEMRVDHGLVPAFLQNVAVESLYAGATLVAPCAHEGFFSGCLVTEAGGFSFSTDREFPLGGRFVLLAMGMRANLEHRIAEHFLLRGFVQLNAVIAPASLQIMEPAWQSSAGFGSFGLTLVSIP